MKFHIPFTFSKIPALKKRSEFYYKYIKYKSDTNLSKNLKSARVDLDRRQYLSIALRSFIHFFIAFYILSAIFTMIIGVNMYYLWAIAISIGISGFMAFNQLVYPKTFVLKRQRNIEKNLLSALEDILVQLNSGIPLFSVLVNISDADYGELSEEFKSAVRKINAGSPEQEVLEELSENNPSVFFKRTLWQISNGMNAGSNMASVVRDSRDALNEEQLIQIQNYGNKLNPLMVFYMLIAVIVPSLSITFLTIFSSMINIPANTTMMLFGGLFVGVVFMQIMFLGLIKSRRPSLL